MWAKVKKLLNNYFQWQEIKLLVLSLLMRLTQWLETGAMVKINHQEELKPSFWSKWMESENKENS